MNNLFKEFTMESKAQVEIEKTWIGKIVDLNELKKAKEVQRIEQWEIKTKGSLLRSNLIRIRNYNDSKYELCIKKDLGEGNGSLEKNVNVDKETFEIFKKIAINGFIRKRFIFPIDDRLKWEIDVYHDSHGNMIDWCKIDLELPKMDMEVRSPFPIKLTEVFLRTDATPEQDEFVNIELFQKRFSIWNEDSILPIEDGSSGGMK